MSDTPTPTVPPPVIIPDPPAPPAISPTGTPLLPARFTPYLMGAATLCATIAGASQIPGLPFPPWVFGWATFCALIFTTAATGTPGLRKTP